MILLHLNEIAEGLYFHCSLFVCVPVYLFVCVSVRLCLWTKFQSNECTDLNVVFAKQVLSTLKLLILGQRSKSQWLTTHFFLHNSLLASLLYISPLLSLIKLKFGMPLWYALADLYLNFTKTKWVMMSLSLSLEAFPFTLWSIFYVNGRFYTLAFYNVLECLSICQQP